MFLCMIDDYQKLRAAKNRYALASSIIESFIEPNANFELNLGGDIRQQLVDKWTRGILDHADKQLRKLSPSLCPRDFFDEVAQFVFVQLGVELLPRFLQSKEFQYAVQSLMQHKGIGQVVSLLDAQLKTSVDFSDIALMSTVTSAPPSPLSTHVEVNMASSESHEEGEDATSDSEETLSDSMDIIISDGPPSTASTPVHSPTSPQQAFSPRTQQIVGASATPRRQNIFQQVVSAVQSPAKDTQVTAEKTHSKRLTHKYVYEHAKCDSPTIGFFSLKRLKALTKPENESVFWNSKTAKDATCTIRSSRKYFRVANSKKIVAYYYDYFVPGFSPKQILSFQHSKEGKLEFNQEVLMECRFVRYISTIDGVKQRLEQLKGRNDASPKDFDMAIQWSGAVALEILKFPKPLKNRYLFAFNAAIPEANGKIIVLVETIGQDPQYMASPKGMECSAYIAGSIYCPEGNGTRYSEFSAINMQTIVPSSILNSTMKSRTTDGYNKLMSMLRQRAEKDQLDQPRTDEYSKSIQRSLVENEEILRLVRESKDAHFGKTFMSGELPDSDQE